MTSPAIPLTVKLERRSSALYAARTRAAKGTLLSDGAVDELVEAFLELHADFAALEQAHDTQDVALDEALTQLRKRREGAA